MSNVEIKVGQVVKVGLAFRMGQGEVSDEYTGTIGKVTRIDGHDLLIEDARGKEVWINARRCEVVAAHDNLAVGTKVYYTGDVANIDGHGAIVAIRPPSRWGGQSYDIVLDDGREMLGTYPNAFEGAGRRFMTIDEFDAMRAETMRRAAAEFDAKRAETMRRVSAEFDAAVAGIGPVPK